MQEIWKDVCGYAGVYQVSNFGNVRSLDRYIKGHKSEFLKKGSTMKQTKRTKGYMFVSFSHEKRKLTCSVHRLVATAFIDNLEDKPQVNHIDCNKSNNSVLNLEWCTNSENQIHAFKNGLNYHNENHRKANIIKGFSKRKLSDEQVCEIKAMRSRGHTYREISETFSISGKMAEQIIKGVKYKLKKAELCLV